MVYVQVRSSLVIQKHKTDSVQRVWQKKNLERGQSYRQVQHVFRWKLRNATGSKIWFRHGITEYSSSTYTCHWVATKLPTGGLEVEPILLQPYQPSSYTELLWFTQWIWGTLNRSKPVAKLWSEVERIILNILRQQTGPFPGCGKHWRGGAFLEVHLLEKISLGWTTKICTFGHLPG